MMIRTLLATACAVAAVALLPVAASAQAPGQDSVNMTGGPGHANLVTVITLSATSGPSGENPSGQVEFLAFNLILTSGPVTCLAVRGKTATINFQDQTGGFGLITVEVVDNEPDAFAANTIRSDPGDCSPLPFSYIGGPL